MTANTKLDAAAYLVTWEDICIPELQHGKRICRKPPGFRKINPSKQSQSESDRAAAAFHLLELSVKLVSWNQTVDRSRSRRLRPLPMSADGSNSPLQRARAFWRPGKWWTTLSRATR